QEGPRAEGDHGWAVNCPMRRAVEWFVPGRGKTMKQEATRRALQSAVQAAAAAGEIMRKNLLAKKRTTEVSRHDIKLELDVQCQKRIERLLCKTHPEVPVLGEEGSLG